MTYWENSLILTLCIRLWNYITLIFKSSAIYRLFVYLSQVWQSSLLYRATSADSRLGIAWEKSRFRALLEFFFNIIPRLLGAMGHALSGSAQNSIFFRFAVWLGRHSAHVISLGILIMLISPYNLWSNNYSLLLVVAAFVLFCLRSVRGNTTQLELRDVGVWPTLFALTAALSFVWSQSPALSLRFLVFSLICILLVVVYVNSVDNEKTLMFAVKCCGIGMFICSAYAVYQGIIGVEVSSAYTDLDLNANMPGRVFSFFDNPNSFANLLVFFAPLMLSMGFYAPETRQKLGFFAVFGLCSVALLMTYARGGWLAFLIAGLALMLILCPRWVPLAIIVGMCFVPFLPDNIIDRVMTTFNFTDTSINSRGAIYSAALMNIGHNPVYGAGLGMDAVKYAVAATGVFGAKFSFIHAHNVFLQIWGESGVFALITFIMALFLPIRAGVRRIKKGLTPITKGVIAGTISGLIGSLVFGLTDYAWSYPRVMTLFWFVFALLLAALRVSNKSNRKDLKSHGQ